MNIPSLPPAALEKIRSSKNITAITGAGISQESGIPTFRGAGGFWKNYKAEELATPEAFSKNPNLVWEWYDWRRDLCLKAEPNPGHLTLAKWESHATSFHLITQNVDGLHVRAGSKQLKQIHGNIFTTRCTKCEDLRPIETSGRDSFCRKCDSPLRPHILWFGEMYDTTLLQSCYEIASRSEVILIIGTSANVSVPASMAEEAIRRGALSIEINPETTSLSGSVDYCLQGKSGEILPKFFYDIYESK
ncbi:SIR2 family NAD-dependent protein deacylase [Leptospira idonii]|uniref:NAD-dependent protein deacylase n=1 Tax=Leptospira idonii TaxID=1193500 RepID=A0A4R9LXJ8_9LEPT|nr:NAD-dependent deacylase [Leptospira idonii]TGN19043.1 NAD-dependent deacylase [Leptospira idonii]